MHVQNEIRTKEKERLIATSDELQDINDHMEKRHEGEDETKYKMWQDMAYLTTENTVRKENAPGNGLF